MEYKLKKAAMFGLDARIALAIFGSLSVISGAALYGAIKQSQLTSFQAQLVELLKGAEAYQVDTLRQMPVNPANTWSGSLGKLVENSTNVKNWKGPYISNERFNQDAIIVKHNGIDYKTFLMFGDSIEWTNGYNNYIQRTCLTDSAVSCYHHILVQATSNTDTLKSLFTQLDDYYDDGDGHSAGRYRFKEVSVNDFRMYYLGHYREM